MDNFNVANNGSFDGASTTGRLTGTLAATTKLAAFGTQQSISGNQLGLAGTHGVRLGSTYFDLRDPSTSAPILADGGFTVSFLWTPTDNTSTGWVSLNMGIGKDVVNLTDGDVDYGILFRNNGGTERWDSGSNLGSGGTIPSPSILPRLVEISYSFNSFADGTNVQAVSKIDGVTLANDTFQWGPNPIGMQLGSIVSGGLIDDFTIATIPEPTSVALLSAGLGLLAFRRRARCA